MRWRTGREQGIGRSSSCCIQSLQRSIQFSCSVVSNSFWPCGLQYARLPVHYQLPQLAQIHVHQDGNAIYPIISSSVGPFSFCLQSFPASGSFLMSSFLAFEGQSIGRPKYWSFRFSLSPSNEYSGLDEARTGIKIARGNISNLRYTFLSKAPRPFIVAYPYWPSIDTVLFFSRGVSITPAIAIPQPHWVHSSFRIFVLTAPISPLLLSTETPLTLQVSFFFFNFI